MRNEEKMRILWASGGASSGAPSRAGGGAIGRATLGRLARPPRFSLRSASILLQSSILIDFYHTIVDAD